MSVPRPRGFLGYLAVIGPGLAIAATGVGAGDMVAAAVSGGRFGFTVAWAALAGAVLKFGLNYELARWQLCTGTTLPRGWTEHLGRWVQYIFMVYLVIWSFWVGGALIGACGMAAHALVPRLSAQSWAVLHSLLGAALVLWFGYGTFERLIKLFIGLMSVTLVGCALFVAPPLESLTELVREASVPAGGTSAILAVLGGVGGSVTLLSYGYWMREKRWSGAEWLPAARIDLAVAYALTGVFGLAVVTLAAHVLHAQQIVVEGQQGVLKMASMMEQVMGPAGKWTFLVGFWGAVSTSLLGVWQGVPYLFADFVALMRRLPDEERKRIVTSRSPWYRGFLFWLAVPPLLMLPFGRPVALIIVYSVMGALFMPFLAATLLYLNTTRRLAAQAPGWASRLLLVLCLTFFGYLAVDKLWDLVRGAMG